MGNGSRDALKETYRLWVEYLKRSKKYALASLWFDVNLKKNPVLMELFSKLTVPQIFMAAYQYPCSMDPQDDGKVRSLFTYFVEWYLGLGSIQIDGEEVNLRALFATYEMVGDVHSDEFRFEEVWSQIEKKDDFIRRAGDVVCLEEDWVLDSVIRGIGSIIYEPLLNILNGDRKPNPKKILDIVKSGFKKYLGYSEVLFTVATCPVSNRGNDPTALDTNISELKEKFGNLVQNHKTKLFDSVMFSGPTRDLYMVPDSKKVNGALERYLAIYDYRKLPQHENLPWGKKFADCFSREYKTAKAKSKLALNIAKASDGDGNLTKVFRELDIRVMNSKGTLRTSDSVFDEAVDKLGKMEDRTLEKEYAKLLFGKEYADRPAYFTPSVIKQGYDRAVKIIQNVEEGIFPGGYEPPL